MAPKPQLKAIESLSVVFLVDNSIEWMTTLPPGFTHEMHQHLFEQQPPIDPVTGVAFLDLEGYCCSAHGFSALIETRETADAPVHCTLFDTGPESKSLVRNIAAMQTDVETIERVVFSHWHADHTGGLLSFLALRKSPVVVDVHPRRPEARGIGTNGTIIARLPDDPQFEEIEAAGGVVERHAEGHTVADDTVYVSGEIPRLTEYETGILGAVTWVDGKWISDELLMDERYAAIDVLGKGLVLFSSCSHAGIVNVVMDAMSTFNRPVYMVIGGLHLAGAELKYRIKPTVDYLHAVGVTYVLPMHCTGFQAKVALENKLGEGCVPAGVGHKITVEGTKEEDAQLRPPKVE